MFIYSSTGSVLDAEPFTGLKTLCEAKGLKYSTYSQRELPIIEAAFTIVEKPLTKAFAPTRVEKIPYTEERAREIAAQYGIAEKVILVWKSRGFIPSKYAKK